MSALQSVDNPEADDLDDKLLKGISSPKKSKEEEKKGENSGQDRIKAFQTQTSGGAHGILITHTNGTEQVADYIHFMTALRTSSKTIQLRYSYMIVNITGENFNTKICEDIRDHKVCAIRPFKAETPGEPEIHKIEWENPANWNPGESQESEKE